MNGSNGMIMVARMEFPAALMLSTYPNPSSKASPASSTQSNKPLNCQEFWRCEMEYMRSKDDFIERLSRGFPLFWGC
jgi:hypothetical protein